MLKSRRHTITNVTISRIALCTLCGAFLLAGANPAYGGDKELDMQSTRSLERMRVEAGFGKLLGKKSDGLEFVSRRGIFAQSDAAVKEEPSRELEGSPMVKATSILRPSKKVSMFLRDSRSAAAWAPPQQSAILRRTLSSLSLHEFTNRPATRTLVQRVTDTLEINLSVGTDHQLDPGHYEENRPSIGLLFERRFR
jgi:hypothetical protein